MDLSIHFINIRITVTNYDILRQTKVKLKWRSTFYERPQCEKHMVNEP